jgi:hypothetical protein
MLQRIKGSREKPGGPAETANAGAFSKVPASASFFYSQLYS